MIYQIKAIQYLRPHGEQRVVTLEVSVEIYEKWEVINSHGY